MREKLIELLKSVKYTIFPNSTDSYDFGVQHSDHIFQQVADHLLDNGVIVLPCKVGDTVYRICHEYKKGNPFIRAVTFNRNNFWRIVFGGELGKTVFLTREEAEAALRKEDERE